MVSKIVAVVAVLVQVSFPDPSIKPNNISKHINIFYAIVINVMNAFCEIMDIRPLVFSDMTPKKSLRAVF
jgi:hypothetical protein